MPSYKVTKIALWDDNLVLVEFDGWRTVAVSFAEFEAGPEVTYPIHEIGYGDDVVWTSKEWEAGQ